MFTIFECTKLAVEMGHRIRPVAVLRLAEANHGPPLKQNEGDIGLCRLFRDFQVDMQKDWGPTRVLHVFASGRLPTTFT